MAEESRLGLDQVDLESKRVFLRADFNVPLAGDAILDDAKLGAAIPRVTYCQEKRASIVLASHLGRPKGKRDPASSLKPVAFALEELLGEVVPLAPDCVGPKCPAFTVAGGGDTVAAIAGAGVAEKFGYLSIAGTAFLEHLEGRELPDVAALTEAMPAGRGAKSR